LERKKDYIHPALRADETTMLGVHNWTAQKLTASGGIRNELSV
jgi:hypothetical protein